MENKLGYCIIIPDFRGIGGAQLYALRRYKHLKEKGYSVRFIVGNIDNTLLDKENCSIPVFEKKEILSFAFDLTRNRVNSVIKEFINFIKVDNLSYSVIESLDPWGASWGELFAERLNCKHVLYSLIEPDFNNIHDKVILDLLRYKLKKQGLIALSSKSLELMFGRFFQESENIFVNIPYNSNELNDYSKPNIDQIIKKNSFIISTVSRLEKPYIEYLIKAVIEIARNSKKSMSLIIAGDSEVGNYKEGLKQKFSEEVNKLENLIIHYPGYLNPLGKDLFKKSNLFIGMGTAAVSSISQGCATLVIDPRNNMSSGIFGIDTNNFAYSESGKQWTIYDSIAKLIKNEELIIKANIAGKKLFEKEFEVNTCMNKLDELIFCEDDKKGYWNYNQVALFYRFARYCYKNRERTIIKILNQIRKAIMNHNV